jgi:hypothetical protein
MALAAAADDDDADAREQAVPPTARPCNERCCCKGALSPSFGGRGVTGVYEAGSIMELRVACTLVGRFKV